MKIIDLYILRKFIGTFFFTLILLLMVAVIIGITDKIDKFIEYELSITEIGQYYLHFCLYYGNVFTPIVIFISVIFFTTKMSNNTEIIAVQSSGVSFQRFLLPFFLGATILGGISFVVNHYFLPDSYIFRSEFEYQYLHSSKTKNKRFEMEDICRKISPNEYVFIKKYHPNTNTGSYFTYEKYNQNDSNELEVKITANQIHWKESDSLFRMYTYTFRENMEGQDNLFNLNIKDTLLGFYPEDILVKIDQAQMLDTDQLDEFIKKEREQGSSRVKNFELEKHRRTSMPFSSYIVMLIGVCLCSKKKRGATGINIFIGVILAFAYLFLSQISDAFVIGGAISPFVAVWIPNVIFGLVSIFLYFKASKM